VGWVVALPQRGIFLLVSLIALAGCTSLPRADAHLVSSAATLGYITTVDELELDRRLYADRCSGCHRLYRPQQYPENEWPEQVTNMRRKAHLTDEEVTHITRYVRSASRISPP
jgi:hypothetical protein